MSTRPATSMTVAIAAALFLGCSVAPSPTSSPTGVASSPTPPGETPPGQTPATETLAPGTPASETPTAPPISTEDVVLVGWRVDGAVAQAITLRGDGATARAALPSLPDGSIATGLPGRLTYVSGGAAHPELWTAPVPPLPMKWLNGPLPARAVLAPYRWPCIAQRGTSVIAIQADDNLVSVIGDVVQVLPTGTLAVRPHGCGWVDADHVVVAADAPSGIALALLQTNGAAPVVLAGIGGEEPATSATQLTFIEHRPGGIFTIDVTALPAGGGVPDPFVRIAPAAGHDYLRPILSADGSRVAVVENDATLRPTRLLLYALTGSSANLVGEVSVSGASDAGVAWVAGR